MLSLRSPRFVRIIACAFFVAATMACTITISTDSSTAPIQVVPPTVPTPIIHGTPIGPAIELEVLADQGWQGTRLQLRPEQPFQIEYVSGEVTDRQTTIAGADGWNYICGHADCCEPLPDARRSALIGKVGEEFFLIGNGGTFTVKTGGPLFLRINDCDEGLYDNSGSLTIHIYR